MHARTHTTHVRTLHQCRGAVERINRNHMVNNLVESYLKLHPGELPHVVHAAQAVVSLTLHLDLQAEMVQHTQL